MSNLAIMKPEYAAYVEALSEALARDDEEAFFSALDHLVHLRTPDFVSEVRKLTGDLQTALDRFRIESRLVDIAENEIPDVRDRLEKVLQMTDAAAHRTLDLVEQSGPLAERTAKEAAALAEWWTEFRRRLADESDTEALSRMEEFLSAARNDCERVRRNLAEVLLTQGYQDLTGQIIRGVMKLVSELESTLAELTQLSGEDLAPKAVRDAIAGRDPSKKPAVASDQKDVDELLSGLGR